MPVTALCRCPDACLHDAATLTRRPALFNVACARGRGGAAGGWVFAGAGWDKFGQILGRCSQNSTHKSQTFLTSVADNPADFSALWWHPELCRGGPCAAKKSIKDRACPWINYAKRFDKPNLGAILRYSIYIFPIISNMRLFLPPYTPFLVT